MHDRRHVKNHPIQAITLDATGKEFGNAAKVVFAHMWLRQYIRDKSFKSDNHRSNEEPRTIPQCDPASFVELDKGEK